eukprot:scaffold206011_cov23-Tisochrysis_lutea.AAC.1
MSEHCQRHHTFFTWRIAKTAIRYTPMGLKTTDNDLGCFADAATPTKHTGLSAAQSLCRKEPGSPDTNNVIRLCPREHHQHTDRTTDSLHSAVSRACDDVVPISTDGHSPDLPRVTHKRGHALKVLDGPAMGIMHSDDYEGVVPICIDGQPPDILYVWGRHGALYTKFSSVT